jgi:two-component system sensor histidine kinase KdpD
MVIDIPDELPLVSCDAVLMQQVFSNLLSNSIKYSPANSKIRITIRMESPQTVSVQVSNQGAKVPQSDLERIFDKFHRITDTDRVTGTGLGLSICKGIVEAHHGKIWAKNLPHELGDPYQFAIEFVIPIHKEGLSPLIPVG